jgi:hypothetical protein
MVKPLGVCATMVLLCGCMRDPCANAQISEDPSPDRRLKAVTFRRDCGATTTYSVRVSIVPASKSLPNEAGNVFVASGEPLVVVRWLADRHLSISGGGASGAHKAETSFRDVRITYD